MHAMTAALGNGITIEYDVHGDGEPLLLVMGLGAQLINWPKEFVDGLVERGFQVIRFDNRDSGLSTHFPDHPLPSQLVNTVALFSRRLARKHAPYVLADEAADAVALLDHLGIERAHVVGASMGGMIAQTIAIGHPQRVASLCSIMSNTGSRRGGRVHPTLLRHSSRFFSRDAERAVDNGIEVSRLISGPHFDADMTRAIIEDSLARDGDPTGLVRQTLAINASPDRTAALAGVTAPTLVIHGMLDRLVAPTGGKRTARAIPGAMLVMFPDMAHDLPRPRWTEIFELIADNARRTGRPVAQAAVAG
jgi:pimeloyl-ACP methyl ester carboxylesterase